MHGSKIPSGKSMVSREASLAGDERAPLAALLQLMRTARDLAQTLRVSDELSKQELLDALAIGELNAHRLLAQKSRQ